MNKVIVSALGLVFFAGSALADPGGAPAAHGTDGQGFGEAVSGAAQGGGIGGHANDSSGNEQAGGAPEAHGTDGRGFGDAVSDAAPGGGIGGHASGGRGP
jgi:hypothetical protein